MNQNQNQNQTQVVNKNQDSGQVQAPGQDPKKKAVFSENDHQAPPWLKKESQNSTKAIVGAENTEKTMEDIVKLRAEKPTATQLGEDPASLIEVTPSFEVVGKTDKEASKKMKEAGYDPLTGKKTEKDEQTAKEDVVKKKQSILDKIKSFFVFKKKSEKVGKQVVQLPKDKKDLIEAEKIYNEGLTSIKDLISPASMDIMYDSVRVDGIYTKSFYVYAYPRYLDVNWLAPVINFGVTMDISQFIYPIGSDRIMKTLKKVKFVILDLRLRLRMLKVCGLRFREVRRSFSNLHFILRFILIAKRSLKGFQSSLRACLLENWL